MVARMINQVVFFTGLGGLDTGADRALANEDVCCSRVWMCHWVDRLGVYMKSLAVIPVETGIPLTDNSLLHNGLDSRLRACEKMAH